MSAFYFCGLWATCFSLLLQEPQRGVLYVFCASFGWPAWLFVMIIEVTECP